MGIHYNTYTNWLKQDKGDLRNEAPHPNNEFYSDKERQRAIEALCKYPDLSVYQLQAKYLDEEGIYLGSVSWLYSVLKQIKTKKTQLKNDTIKTNQKLLRQSSSATDVNQVWCWDITYLYSPIVGKYYYLYSIMDLYSRYIVHYEVHDKQSDSLASECIKTAVKSKEIVWSNQVLIFTV